MASPTTTRPSLTSAETRALAARYRDVRRFSETLAAPLTPEDCTVQSMPDVSPTKWHLAHTTWFFETFVFEKEPGYEAFEPQYRMLFNSYYNGIGEQFPRPRRGFISRPGLGEVLEYRRHVDEAMLALLERDTSMDADIRAIVEIGLHHEQQHQELILTDIKHVLSQNPLRPTYLRAAKPPTAETQDSDHPSPQSNWVHFEEGLYSIGHGGSGFAYDNESPRHRTFLESFGLASRPVTSGEWLQFIEDGGYAQPGLWLSMGWSTVCHENWRAPLYWFEWEDQWWQFTLSGARPVDPHEPVCHVSYFEADAFARWAGYRLPTEAEWEVAATNEPITGNFVDTLIEAGRAPHPVAPAASGSSARPLQQLFGDVWEWTASPYTPYPGYRAPEGALGEYNGKFMCNQYVLRGGSCATHSTHLRTTYRNFFPPEARWQFTGLRLARDA